MILILKTSLIMDPVMQCQPSFSQLKISQKILFHFSRIQHIAIRLPHSEIVDNMKKFSALDATSTRTASAAAKPCQGDSLRILSPDTGKHFPDVAASD
ncbi:hypothetical protein Tco_1302856 [Tanacetum coccineum]